MNNLIWYCLVLCMIEISAKKIPLLGSSKTLSLLQPRIPTFDDHAAKLGVPCEVYNVTTADGYILGLFRIPGDKQRPVLLMHGILDSADDFILRQNSSHALTLAREGYDVWVGNSRGNRYSRRHLNLDPDLDKKFWDYSFHDMGYYDLPAIIDFILARTGQFKLSAIGHSEGTTIFYVLGSTRPEYNEKISVLASLAPVAYLHKSKGLLPIVMKFAPVINEVIEQINCHEVFGFYSNLKVLAQKFCSKPSGYEICSNLLVAPLFGADSRQLEPEFLGKLLKHFPSGTSRVNLVHFAQVGNSGIFAHFDHGSEKNMKVYGSINPPEYNLTKVTFNVGLYLGANDFIATVDNAEILRRQLPNIVDYLVLDYPQWNHVDHMTGKFMPKYLFPPILKLLKMYAS